MKAVLRLAMILLCTSAFCQTASEPIPSKWLRDGHLVVPELNFSLEPPTPGSHWSYQELPNIEGSKATAFIADADQERYALIVMEKGGSVKLDDPVSRKRFLDDLQTSLPKNWQAVGDPQSEQTTVPVSGSWKVRVTIRRPEGDIFMYAYAIGGKRVYMLVDYSTETVEPPRFSRFVASFSLLSPRFKRFHSCCDT